MARSAVPIGTEPPLSLPIFDRLAAPPPRKSLIARIERHTAANDVVVDLQGRGGWVARAAIERRRRAVSIESTPLTRLLAELVLRPPDIRHLDAAYQSIAAAARGKSNLRRVLAESYATRCATCDRVVTADVIVWRGEPVSKRYRCLACRNQQSAAEVREAPVDDSDRERAASAPGVGKARATLARRFPIPDPHAGLVDRLLDLHSERQLVGLAAILEQVEAQGRGNHVDAALRLAFAHAVHPASRLATHAARTAPLRIAGGRVRLPSAAEWYEQSAWSAFDDGFRLIRAFIQRLEAQSGRGDGDAHPGSLQARYADDISALADGGASAVVRLATKGTWQKLRRECRDLADRDSHPRVPLVLAQLPSSRSSDALALEYHITAWTLGAAAAATLPIEPLLGGRVPSAEDDAAALAASLAAIEPLLERDGRAIVLVGGGAQPALTAAALGGVAAGFRVASARLPESGDSDGYVELVPPGAAPPPGPRTRANVALPAIPGGPGDPDLVPGPGLFTPPERHDARRFSAVDVGRTVTETAVDVLRARGEPASSAVLFGEILAALDRGGHLRRLVAERGADGSAPNSVERLVGIVRAELGESKYRRLREIAPDQWWLSDRDDRDAAAAPLADRVEWAVYSLLSTSGTLSESAFIDRVTGLFASHDRPDESLVRACLDSYRSNPDDVEHVTTTEDLLARTHEHGLLLADLAAGGHRLDMRVWISAREQARRIGERRLGDVLDDAERRVDLPLVAPGPLETLEAVDCIWYVPGRVAFLFEVEWTAMIGETILRRHARIPPDDRVVRFIVVPPERAPLVRHKIDRSPLLREAVAEGNWHVLKWDHLRAFLAHEPLSLDALEPFLGLEPAVERGEARQLPLFAG